MKLETSSACRLAVIDTTVQIDRRKSKHRMDQIESLLTQFDQTIATGLSLVEFKAVLIQQLITIYNQLRRSGARLTHVRDVLCEKSHPQSKLRQHIFSNIIAVQIGSSFEVSDEEDQKAALTARLKLEDVIPRIYLWFKEKSASVYWNKQGFACDRADEPPKRKGAVFEATLPNCVRGKNKTCRVEEVIRRKWPTIQTRFPVLDSENREHQQLIKATDLLNAVCSDAKRELSVNDCRNGGDILIAVEVLDVATHSLSTNARDWKVISQSCGFEFVHVRYEGEETH